MDKEKAIKLVEEFTKAVETIGDYEEAKKLFCNHYKLTNTQFANLLYYVFVK